MEAFKEEQTLAEALLEVREQEGVTFEALSQISGVARSTISQVANRGARLKSELEQKLWDAIHEIRATSSALEPKEATVLPVEHYKSAVELYETDEYKEAMGWCHYVYAKRKPGVLVGYPGSGKTTVLRQFARLHPGVIYIEAWHTMRIGDMLGCIGDAIGADLRGNNYRKTQTLINALRGREDLLIAIDEAEYLCRNNVDKIEVLRKIWDNTGTPLILCGTPAMAKLLTVGKGGENLAQLYRRKVEMQLKGIGAPEARRVLQDYNVDPEAADALAAIAADVKHGGMGTFVEILDLCLEAAEGGRITKEILASAKRYKLMY